VGDQASTKKIFGEEDVKIFAKISTDVNPIHLDKEYASTTRFKRPVVHGIFTASLLSAVVGILPHIYPFI
jgi:3-hydroxybutyryl-CoA dehydratase